MDDWKEESIDKAKFDEYDPSDESDCALRTIVDFELFDAATGQMAGYEQLGKPDLHISLRGYVIEPLPQEWRQTIMKLLSTVDSSKIAVDGGKEETIVDEVHPEFIPFDASSLSVGDLLDGYCNKTFKWYEAKVIQINEAENKIKLHFQKWSSKFDEWIDRSSERLAAHGMSSIIMRKVASMVTKQLPWYESNAKILQRASEELNQPIPERKLQGVLVDRIDDWCIDYTYPNPTLWLISDSGVWYRVAGALTPGGHQGMPSDVYRPIFRELHEVFYCAAHLAMCLLDLLHSAPTAGLQMIADEVAARSGNEVNELLILRHYNFLVDQLSGLEKPAEWDPKFSIPKSVFMNQLKKEGSSFENAGGFEALMVSMDMSNTSVHTYIQLCRYIHAYMQIYLCLYVIFYQNSTILGYYQSKYMFIIN